jgi:hypothetical protein
MASTRRSRSQRGQSLTIRTVAYLLVSSVVRLEDVARQATAVTDRPSTALGPVTDGFQCFATPAGRLRRGTFRARRAASPARAGASASPWCRLPGRLGRRCDPLLIKRQAGVFGSGLTLGGQNVSACSIGASPARHSTLATGAVTTRRALDSTILDEACAGAGDVNPVVDDSSGTTAERSCPPTSS